MSVGELELAVRPAGAGHVADLRLWTTDGVERELARAAPAGLDLTALLACSNDPDAYGATLSAQLFQGPLREAWTRAEAWTQGSRSPLRLSLRIDPDAPALHTLRWECLRDPVGAFPLARAERILFSRYFPTSDLGAIVVPAECNLRALVAVAGPSDQRTFRLEPVDVPGELARIGAALAGLPATTLASQPHGSGVTLAGLMAALGAGHHVLYLLCHGQMVDGEAYLWLEHPDGTGHPVRAAQFVEQFRGLTDAQRPLLVVLAACRSAGGPDPAPVLAAVAPQLVHAGIGAVLAMQGDVPMPLVEQLMPRFFQLLFADGRLDHALAVARRELPEDLPWWMPVLYSRLPQGRLWETQPPEARQAVEGLGALRALMGDQTARELIAGFEDQIGAARAQVNDVIALKEIHDQLHLVQFTCYNPLTREQGRFPDDEVALESVADYELTLQACLARINAIFSRAGDAPGDRAWVADLTLAGTTLSRAVAQRDGQELRRAIGQLNRVLARQPAIVNANLIARVGAMPLRTLVATLVGLRANLGRLEHGPALLQSFEAGLAALVLLSGELTAQVAAHNAWQAIDLDTRHVEEMLRRDTTELEIAWPDLGPKICAVAAGPADWAGALRARVALVDAGMAAGAPAHAAREFRLLRSLVGARFFQVDVDLLQLCSRLRELHDPLDELEKALR